MDRLSKGHPEQTETCRDNPGSKRNCKEGNTALQYDGFVHVFEDGVYVFYARRAVNHPLQLIPNARK
uniref:Arabinan endo-1,5-alpha-L-arabinosidase n=1 Tax=Panagrellus redivivus TaxID=6233 RepID=A0A7E4VKK6_PANRE